MLTDLLGLQRLKLGNLVLLVILLNLTLLLLLLQHLLLLLLQIPLLQILYYFHRMGLKNLN